MESQRSDHTELTPDDAHPSVGIADSYIHSVEESLQEDNTISLEDQLKSLSPSDCADLIQKLSDEDRKDLIENCRQFIKPETYAELDHAVQRSVLSSLPSPQVASIVSELDSDDALDLIINLEESFQQDVIRHLSAKTRVALEEGMSFPEDSAGRLMQREYVAVPQFWTVGKTIDYIRAARDELPSDFFDVMIIDPMYHIQGEIPLNKLVRAKREEKIADLSLESSHSIPADMDQEEVARIFQRENLGSAPVVDTDNRLIGVITIDDIIDVITEEAEEDILKLAGVADSDLYSAVFSTSARRFRWLFVNLLTAILASIVISFFDTTIEDVVALAILMPIVASMGGNAGTQALTVAVRALATKELSQANMFRVIWKETLVGLLNGLGFAILAGLVAALWFSNMVLGFVIALAMVINLVVAGIFGAGIPIFLERCGSDPALSSTVFLTTVTDVVGFFGFLGLASIFLL